MFSFQIKCFKKQFNRCKFFRWVSKIVLKRSTFIAFASKVGKDVIVKDNSTTVAFTNNQESKDFKHPIFTDM